MNDKKNVFSCAAAADEKHDALSVGTKRREEKSLRFGSEGEASDECCSSGKKVCRSLRAIKSKLLKFGLK